MEYGFIYKMEISYNNNNQTIEMIKQKTVGWEVIVQEIVTEFAIASKSSNLRIVIIYTITWPNQKDLISA